MFYRRGSMDELAENLSRILRKMERKLNPGDDSDSEMIDLVAHAKDLLSQLRREIDHA